MTFYSIATVKTNLCVLPHCNSQLLNFLLIYLEIPLFHVLNAKVTFGNIGGGESPVSGVHAINVDIKEIDENNGTFAAEQDEAEAAAVSGMASRCVIETTCFDAPVGYREVNLDQHPTGKYKF